MASFGFLADGSWREEGEGLEDGVLFGNDSIFL